MNNQLFSFILENRKISSIFGRKNVSKETIRGDRNATISFLFWRERNILLSFVSWLVFVFCFLSFSFPLINSCLLKEKVWYATWLRESYRTFVPIDTIPFLILFIHRDSFLFPSWSLLSQEELVVIKLLISFKSSYEEECN